MRAFERHKTKNDKLNSSSFFSPTIQRKLITGEPNDPYEKEADKMADAVINRSKSNNPSFFSSKNNKRSNSETGTLIQEKPLAQQITSFIQGKEAPSMSSDKKEEDKTQEKSVGEQKATEEKDQKEVQKKEGKDEDEKPVQKKENEIPQKDLKEEEKTVKKASGEIQNPSDEKKEDLQKKGEVNDSEQEEEKVQAKTECNTPPSPRTETALRQNKGNGKPLLKQNRAEMERGFGANLSNVRIHTDEQAIQMSSELGAQAFTNGNDIYFNKGKYNPESSEGKHLLAHEITHTIQQSGMVPLSIQYTIGDGNDLGSTRFSGNDILEACLDGERTLKKGDTGAAVSLIQQALVDAGFPLPRFGVDGIFGNETHGALQNFQRSSSLDSDGKLGKKTMSALDALFTKGAPSPGTATPLPTPSGPPAVTTETIKSAPGGDPDTRTIVGVGERVRLTSDTAGTWTATEGHFIGLNNGSNVVWEAPATAANPQISITTPGGTKVTPFSVVTPNSLSMTVLFHEPIATGSSGADMHTEATVNPVNVNFGRLQWLEVPGPATNISGYFTAFPAASLAHQPNKDYVPFDDNNIYVSDHCALTDCAAPFSSGTFEWVIPNRYIVDGEATSRGRLFTNTTQAFYMFSNGSVMITKAGALVLRTINNVII